MSSWRTCLLCLLLALARAPAAAAGAPAAARAEQGAQVSMEQAVRMVEQRFHARVVKAESRSDDGHTTYVLRLLNDSGKVWTVHVDAASGAVQ